MKRKLRLIVGLIALIAAGAALYYFVLRGWYFPPPISFAGDSSKLKHTVIVPTLDTPMPAGKNVIWCASFQLAWNEVRDNVVKEPIRLENAQEIADRLNKGMFTKIDLSPDEYFAAAGFASDQLFDSIEKALDNDYKDIPQLPVKRVSDGIVAYAILDVNAKFKMPYLQNPNPLQFMDSTGSKTPVSSFGALSGDSGRSSQELREQAKVLYHHIPGANPDTHVYEDQADEFVLDLSDQTDTQVLVALVPRQDSLADLLAYISQKQLAFEEEHKKQQMLNSPGAYPDFRRVGGLDTIMVPDMNWRVTHHFKELEGQDKLLQNKLGKGLPLLEAVQQICFTLDRSGARASSSSWQVYAAMPQTYAFDKPFLVVLRKRDAVNPFFVMWVDNVELLNKT